MNKFVYFSPTTLQLPRVARQCIMGLCDEISLIGYIVEVVSILTNIDKNEPKHPEYKELYQLKSDIKIKEYNARYISIDKFPKLFGFLRLVFFLSFLIKYFFYEYHRYQRSIFTSRNTSILIMLVIFKRLLMKNAYIIADVHGMPTTKTEFWMHRNVDKNMCLSEYLMKSLADLLDLDCNKMGFAHTGISERELNCIYDKNKIRIDLGLPTNKKIICYAGKLYYRYEEIDYYLRAAKEIPEAVFLIIGGRIDQTMKWKQEAKSNNVLNIKFIEFVKPRLVNEYLAASDILLVYYSKNKLNDYRSPAKLFKYLSTGTPIISGDYESTKEVLINNYNGFIIPAYDFVILVDSLKSILEIPNNRLEEISRNAKETIKKFTFKNRAIKFVELV